MSKAFPQFQPVEKHPAPAPISAPLEFGLGIGISIALLIPCVWQEHIQAGDLSSHLYNAWLAARIREGGVPGLYLAHPWTNVLCDWILETLVNRLGVASAERIVSGAAVLIFFWGAFFLINRVSRRHPWLLTPALAVIAYGLVFNVGFLNFYVSTGICLWILGLLWEPSPKRILISVPLWVLAILAHAMPPVWAGFAILYSTALRVFPSKMRWGVLAATTATMVAAQVVVMRTFPFRWSVDQVMSLLGVLGLTGTDQVFLSGPKYLIIVAGFGLVWCVLLLERLDQRGMMDDPLVHVWLLQLAGFVLTPLSIQLPQYQSVFSYIPQRLSLWNALIFCAVVGRARHGRGITRLTAAVATLYFTFLYIDTKAFNELESQVTALVSTLPPGQKLVASLNDSNSRINPVMHVVDRACIGRCFSYGNYEPASGQFRIRISGPNSVVTTSTDEVIEISDGRHVVTPAESPIYSVCDCGGSLCLRRLNAGERMCSVSIPVSPSLWTMRTDRFRADRSSATRATLTPYQNPYQ